MLKAYQTAFGDCLQMTLSPTSSADFFTLEEREEMRFLNALKGELREVAAMIQEHESLSQEQLAARLGYDAGQFSKILSADRHNSTGTIFRALFRMGRRWMLSSKPLPSKLGNQILHDLPTERIIAVPAKTNTAALSVMFQTSLGPTAASGSTVVNGMTEMAA